MTGATPRAAIVGIAAATLQAQEAALLRAFPPVGIILFSRNICDPVQLVALIASIRLACGPATLVMVDQEGGRVARLKPPFWRTHPPARMFGSLFQSNPATGIRAAWLTGALIGCECRSTGFAVAAAPVLDIAFQGAHDVIGDRAFASHPVTVARIGRALANGLMAGGTLPVGKHLPGHGRARVDSHLALPTVSTVDLSDDIQPFALNADLPWMMTAHIIYTGIDPLRPATLSAKVIKTIIRGQIGFQGVLVTDDLAMKALSGAPANLAVEALAAGCDIALYCSGDFALTEALLQACPPVTADCEQRLRSGYSAVASRRMRLDPVALAAERERLLA